MFVAKEALLFAILKVSSESFSPILKVSPLAVVKFKAESFPFTLVSSVATSEKIPLVAVVLPAKVAFKLEAKLKKSVPVLFFIVKVVLP